MATQSGTSWWIGLNRTQHMAEALKRAPVMSNAPEAKSVDSVQGLSAGLPKSYLTPKKRLGISA